MGGSRSPRRRAGRGIGRPSIGIGLRSMALLALGLQWAIANDPIVRIEFDGWVTGGASNGAVNTVQRESRLVVVEAISAPGSRIGVTTLAGSSICARCVTPLDELAGMRISMARCATRREVPIAAGSHVGLRGLRRSVTLLAGGFAMGPSELVGCAR